MARHASCKFNYSAVQTVRSNGQGKAPGGLEIVDIASVALQSSDEGSNWTLLHACVSSDDGLVSVFRRSLLDQRADGCEEARSGTCIAEINLLAWSGNREVASAAYDYKSLSGVFP